MSLVIAGIISTVAVRLLAMPGAWDTVFTLLSMATVIALAIVAEIARHRKGDYLGRLVTRLGRLLGRPLETSRVVRFILDVEDVLLDLLRGDRRRLVILTILPVVCYLLTAFEVWLVLWAVGEPVGIMAALAIDTFARLGSVASAAIPAGIGALEASNAAPVAMLGLGGGGVLALTRRVRALLWAGVGLALYPRVKRREPDRAVEPAVSAGPQWTRPANRVPASRRGLRVRLSPVSPLPVRASDRAWRNRTAARARPFRPHRGTARWGSPRRRDLASTGSRSPHPARA